MAKHFWMYYTVYSFRGRNWANVSCRNISHLHVFLSLKQRLINEQVLPKHFVGPRLVDKKDSAQKKIWNKSTPLKNKQILVGGFQPVWKICASHIGSFCHGVGWKFKKNALKLPRKFSCHAPHNLQPHEAPFFPRHMAARNSFSASLFSWEVNGSDLFLNFFVGHVVFRGSELRTFR